LNPSVLSTLDKKFDGAKKLDNELYNQEIELALQEFVKEASKSGMIS